MSITSEAQKELQQLQASIRRDNKKLELLQRVLAEYNDKQPNTLKLNELIMDCLKDHQGHAEFDEVVDFLTAQYAFLSRQRISLALTKCPYAKYNGKHWELCPLTSGKTHKSPDNENIVSH